MNAKTATVKKPAALVWPKPAKPEPALKAAPKKSKDPAIETLARTIYGEARGELVRGKEAVAAVVMNRVRRAMERGGYWWGSTAEEVCLRPWQFSCWNENDPNREKILAVGRDNRNFQSCLRIARRALADVLPMTYLDLAEDKPVLAIARLQKFRDSYPGTLAALEARRLERALDEISSTLTRSKGKPKLKPPPAQPDKAR